MKSLLVLTCLVAVCFVATNAMSLDETGLLNLLEKEIEKRGTVLECPTLGVDCDINDGGAGRCVYGKGTKQICLRVCPVSGCATDQFCDVQENVCRRKAATSGPRPCIDKPCIETGSGMGTCYNEKCLMKCRKAGSDCNLHNEILGTCTDVGAATPVCIPNGKKRSLLDQLVGILKNIN